MPYCKREEQESRAVARFNAVHEVLKEHRTPAEVARRFGVYDSTIKRWVERFLELQKAHEISWKCKKLPIKSSRPHTSPNRISEELAYRIIELKLSMNRCAEVIHQELVNDGYKVSLSTVERVLSNTHLVKEKSKWKKIRKTTARPKVDHPGALVEVDTVHFYHPITKTRRYATTVIDVYTRIVYVYIHNRMTQKASAIAVKRAKRTFGFRFDVIQTDNGPEFGKKFQDLVTNSHTRYRHTRVATPNDNAHIERFNRTLREECLGDYLPEKELISKTQERVDKYIDYYNHHRLHLGLQLMTPADYFLRSC